MKSKKFLTFSILLMALLVSATTISAQGPPFKSWTAAGSAGTVDIADEAKVFYSNGTVAFREIASQLSAARIRNLPLQTVTAVIRYNVTAVDGLFFESGARLCMSTRFRDNGARARVVLRLVEFSLSTGVTTTRLTFDSNTVPPQANFQVNSASTDFHAFDFSQNAYYVEATLTKQQPVATSVGAGRPGLGIIQMSKCIVF